MFIYTDQLGRTIQLSAVPSRIISLVPSQTELLFALGLNEQVIGITKFTAGQLAPHGVCVNAIAPGVTMTEATKKVVPGELIAMLTAATPMRCTLEPEDLAGAAVFLASEDARYVTGQVLCVDGGMQMPA